MVIFSIFYGVVSFSFKYYGEMTTYLLMTTPLAIIAIFTWLKNPYDGKKSEIKIHIIKKKEMFLLLILSFFVTIVFYYLLKYLNTSNLIISTISVFTSFIAAYLEMRRSKYYAIAYALNDIVLIILWILASIVSAKYVALIICFIAFLINDLYGFINWNKLEKKQKEVS